MRRAGDYGCQPLHIRALPAAKHVFTHREWHMHGYEIRIGSFPEVPEDPDRTGEDTAPAGECFIATIGDIEEKYALPGALAAYNPRALSVRG